MSLPAPPDCDYVEDLALVVDGEDDSATAHSGLPKVSEAGQRRGNPAIAWVQGQFVNTGREGSKAMLTLYLFPAHGAARLDVLKSFLNRRQNLTAEGLLTPKPRLG